MAIVVGPLHSSEARGRVGSLVYNTHRGRAYVKAHVSPTTQNTQKQLDARAIMHTVVAAWQSITDADRAAWNHFATLHLRDSWTGQAKRLSGFNWYCLCNYRVYYIYTTTFDTPPQTMWPDFDRNIQIYGDANSVWFDWTPGVDPAGLELFLFFWITGPHSPGASPSIKTASLSTFIPAVDGYVAISGLSPGFYTVFVNVVTGEGLPLPYLRFTAEAI